MAKDEEKKSKKRKSIVPGEEAAAPVAEAESPAKKSKKEKRKSLAGEEAADVSMVDAADVADVSSPVKKDKKDKKDKKEDKDEFAVPLEAIAPIAAPLAGKKLSKKLFKTVKKASKARQLKRGVKEVVKSLRKGEKGLLLLASNITPIDILSHLPILAEESGVKYVWVLAKEELGQAAGTKRATSCVLICEAQRKRKASATGEVAKGGEDWKEGWDELIKEVDELDQKIAF
ncbi:nucleolar protein family a member 2 [Phaffia rhodozyma]|uniref:H/ACA ribonucleoprotein complex subunit 2 n=1 Tax=Phaffia rhodozyma TaxID=264483 RepID=A0A0F7SVB3_PHARH|nr:nucleolar protein family a member 2 [Phaffia rhodozyma]